MTGVAYAHLSRLSGTFLQINAVYADIPITFHPRAMSHCSLCMDPDSLHPTLHLLGSSFHVTFLHYLIFHAWNGCPSKTFPSALAILFSLLDIELQRTGPSPDHWPWSLAPEEEEDMNT